MMDFLSSLLAPFWLLWSLCELFSYVTLLIAVSATLGVLIAIKSKKNIPKRRKAVFEPSVIVTEVIQILPLHSKNGWCLDEVDQGLRVFSRFFPAFFSSTVLACATLLDVKPKRALQYALSTTEFSTWMSMVRGTVQQVKKPHHSLNKLTCSADSDIISITFKNTPDTYTTYSSILLSYIKRYSGSYILSMLGINSRNSDFVVERMERSWDCQDDRLCHLLSVTSQMSFLPYLWSLLIFSSIPNHSELSLVTLVAMPNSMSALPATRKCITAQLCALREHTLLKQLKLYSCTLSLTNHVADEQLNNKASASSTDATTSNQEPIPVPSVSQSEVIPHSPQKQDDPYFDIDRKYLSMAEQCSKEILSAANATEQDGWTVVGTSKNVFIMKKTPAKGEAPINCVKGRGEINCPPDFIMKIIMDPSRAAVLDDMLKEMKILKNLSDSMQLVHLQYKAVWPTAARDFSVVNVFGRSDPQTRVHAARSVVDPRIPEEKGFVRGDVISGGYVIKDVPNNPEKADVIYLTQVDLKGNVPSFIINKVTESQPQCVNHLRNVAETEYNKLKRNPVKMKQFEDEFPIPDIKEAPELPTTFVPETNVSRSSIDDSPPHQSLIVTAEVHDTDASNQSVLKPPEIPSTEAEGNGCTENTQSSNDPEDVFGEDRVPTIPTSAVLKKLPRYRSENVGETATIPQDQPQAQATSNHIIEYPRSGQEIDYRTLGNQSAARLLEELFNVSELHLDDPSTFVDQQNGWKYQGIEKNVVVLKKKLPDSCFYSFMGKGIIELPPQEIYNCVRNPNQRFTFDNMLKELHIVKQIDDGLYILHLHHEMTQCFLKQARDFCLLVCERSEPNKKLIVGSSVDVSDCPPQQNVTRGKINTSGWVIEPYRQNEKLCTQVTYLVQVDMVGVPTTIVNMIGRRQPLAIAYLRDYLQATSLNYTNDRLMENDEFTNSLPTLIFKT